MTPKALSNELQERRERYFEALGELRDRLEPILKTILPNVPWKVEVGWSEDPCCVCVFTPKRRGERFAEPLLPREHPLSRFVDCPVGLTLTAAEADVLRRSRDRLVRFLEFGGGR